MNSWRNDKIGMQNSKSLLDFRYPVLALLLFNQWLNLMLVCFVGGSMNFRLHHDEREGSALSMLDSSTHLPEILVIKISCFRIFPAISCLLFFFLKSVLVRKRRCLWHLFSQHKERECRTRNSLAWSAMISDLCREGLVLVHIS
jgi:hypothetical protein